MREGFSQRDSYGRTPPEPHKKICDLENYSSQYFKELHPNKRFSKPGHHGPLLSGLAEREGFEPPEPLSSTVFKTAAIDHSAISPIILRTSP